MRRTVGNIISVIYSFIKFSIMKLFNWNGFSFHPVERFSPSVVTDFNRGSIVTIGKMVRVHSRTRIRAHRNSVLTIGEGVKINCDCFIICQERIEIGAGTEFGPSVYLYDHDHDYRVGLKKEQYKSAPIIIGKDCWIGANTVILRGTQIGDNCVVGAGCVLSGQYENNSIIVQKRTTEFWKY